MLHAQFLLTVTVWEEGATSSVKNWRGIPERLTLSDGRSPPIKHPPYEVVVHGDRIAQLLVHSKGVS